ncbi:TIGR03089 family protein [Cellulomonas sp. C5510]|nr:TIGR03089 family protein [Cellulomonas sp. C5510]
MSALLTEPGRPRVTWYGPDGERIELSGAVLDNWVSKTTNLLVEELDAGPGTTVRVDLPPHWRSLVWTLAAWRVGATVLPPDAPDGDVVVTDRPDAAAPRDAAVVAVALPALARRFDGDLPAGALDAAASVMTYGDVVGWAPEVEPQREALAGGADGTVRHADLLATAVGAAEQGPAAGVPGARALLEVGDDRTTAPATALAVLGVLAGGGSVVLLRPEPGDDAARADRIAATERVTARA